MRLSSRLAVFFTAALAAFAAHAVVPESGFWWNPQQPGRGWTIEEQGGWRRAIFGVVTDKRTYGSFFYLLVSFPVGLALWVALVTLLAVGGGLAITVVGIPLLVVTMFGWCFASDLERLLSNTLLGTKIRPLPFGAERNERWPWARLRARFRNRYTWRSFFYELILRLPMGIAGLVVIGFTIVQALHLIVTPVHVAIGMDNQIGPWVLDSMMDAMIAFPIGLLWCGVSASRRSVQDVVLRTSVIYDWRPRREHGEPALTA
jgi:ribose/xylose/arabinose/galactoside ABC-type transport system permease subunit